MASSTSNGPRGPITSINVTPLVDVTLVLLIIFMVTAKFVRNDSALKVNLPEAATGGVVQEILSLVVTSDGTIEVNGLETPGDKLVMHARAMKEKNPQVRAVIQADARVNHGRVMYVLDILRQADIGKVAFGVMASKPSAGQARD